MELTSQKKILLVEDEEIIAHIEIKQLEEEGYIVFRAETGMQAIELVNAHKGDFDLILMDIDLGVGIDGTITANEILKVFYIPILFLSSHTEKEIVEKTEQISSFGYVVKSSSFTVLHASMKMAFKLFDSLTKQKILQKENSMKAAVLDSVATPILITDPNGNIEWINPAFSETTGFSEAEVIGKNSKILINSGKQNQSFYKDLWDTILSGKVWRGEVINRFKDGSLHCEEETISPVIGLDGKINHFIGIKQDITQKKIQADYKELTSRVFTHAHEGITIADSDGKIMEVNAEFTRITGYTSEEVVGQTHRIFKSGTHSPEFYTSMWETLLSKGYWTGEIWNKRKNGEIYPQLLTISAVKNSESIIKNYVSIFSDISERKKAETEILIAKKKSELNENMFSLLFDTLPIGITIASETGQIIKSNLAAERILGLSSDEHRQREIDGVEWTIIRTDGTIMPPEEYASVRALKEKQPIYGIEMGVTTGINKITWINVNAAPMAGYGVLISYEDITIKKQVEAKLRHSAETESMLSSISLELISSGMKRMEETITHILAQFGKFAGVDRAFMFLYPSTDKDSYLFPEWCADGIESQLKFFSNISIKHCQWAMKSLESSEILNIPNIEILPKDSEEIKEICRVVSNKSFLYVPLQIDGVIKGLFGFQSVLKPRVWEEDTVYLLKAAGEIVATTIRRNQSEEKIQSLLEEKELILKEVHHRIKNNMNVVMALLMMQANSQDNEKAKNVLEDAGNRVRSMAILYDKLYQSDSKNEISLKLYIPSLLSEIASMFLIQAKVEIVTDIEDIILPPKLISPLGIILNELFTNAMKYAFLDRDNGVISVTASKKARRIFLLFQDNGNGFSNENTVNSTGFGMQLINILVKQLQGSFTLESNQGAKFTFEFDS